MSRPDTPERIALEELVAAIEGMEGGKPWNFHLRQARLTMALNAARNALQGGWVLDGIAADPGIGHGHVGSVG